MRHHTSVFRVSWRWWVSSSIILVVATTRSYCSAATSAARQEKVKVRLRNDGRVRMEVGWIDRKDHTIHPISVLEPFGFFDMQSYFCHEFELLELPSDASGKCEVNQLPSSSAPSASRSSRGGDDASSSSSSSNSKPLALQDGCVISKFRITKQKEQNFLVTDRLKIRNDDAMDGVYSFQAVKPSEHFGTCRFEAKRRLLKGKSDGYSKKMTDKILEQFKDCLAQGVAPNFKRARDEIKFEQHVLTTVSASLENYTCTKELDESTPDVEQRDWTSEKDNITRLVHVKFDRPASRIHVVENFASVEECDAMEKSVAGRLGIATTEDGKGGSHVNKNRKALQAYIEPDWSKEAEGDPILKLNRRIFDYTNHVLGLNISVDGQEPLMSIQYKGRGSSDIEPDRYTPHCDGRCEGRPFSHASRMATMVIYCEVPGDGGGGHTNFGNAGVTIKPQRGSGIFFSYIDPLTNITDRGYTRHSGCPVFEGEKKIITQWIRLGVNAEITNEAYNSLEVLISEDGE